MAVVIASKIAIVGLLSLVKIIISLIALLIEVVAKVIFLATVNTLAVVLVKYRNTMHVAV